MSTVDDRKVDAGTLVDYAKTLDCVHCGLCLNTCPTYRLTGVESSSPRGRIQLMRAVAENELAPEPAFVEEMEFCLLCRNCESVCPSGVRFGALMEHTRDGLARGGQVRPHWTTRFAFRAVLPRRPRHAYTRCACVHVHIPQPQPAQLRVAEPGQHQRLDDHPVGGRFHAVAFPLGQKPPQLGRFPLVQEQLCGDFPGFSGHGQSADVIKTDQK